MAFQTLDVVAAMSAASGTRPAEMRVDGGASAMNLLCQIQADLLGVPVRRSSIQETTALGAAYLAGIAEGVWSTAAEAAAAWTADASFTPPSNPTNARHGLRVAPRARAFARMGVGRRAVTAGSTLLSSRGLPRRW